MQITVTLFMTREEIFECIFKQTKKFDLYFALVKYYPNFEIIPLPNWEQFKEQDQKHKLREIWIDIKPIVSVCNGQKDCCEKNQNRLSFYLPERTDNGLREGSLGTLSEDELRLKKWKSIIGFIKRKTKAGMWVLNTNNNSKGFYKHLRYSAKIEELHHNGLQLLPIAGWSQIYINEPV